MRSLRSTSSSSIASTASGDHLVQVWHDDGHDGCAIEGGLMATTWSRSGMMMVMMAVFIRVGALSIGVKRSKSDAPSNGLEQHRTHIQHVSSRVR